MTANIKNNGAILNKCIKTPLFKVFILYKDKNIIINVKNPNTTYPINSTVKKLDLYVITSKLDNRLNKIPNENNITLTIAKNK
jgi:galactitol-specific phosphotransferase system IIB component